tara:strand:- start:2619 stop:3152 length:534 start_codon:yes stop_codon:yes gene_type:complete
MNIFITNECPTACAAVLCDQHVRSQVEETARILTTALHRHKITGPLLGKPYNVNGRFAKWAASDWSHFMWLAFHGMALIEEYDRRFGEIHKSSAEIVAAGQIGHLMGDGPPDIPVLWPRCEAARALIENRSLDVFDAYEEVLRMKYEAWTAQGSKTPKWTNTRPPDWMGGSSSSLFR